MEWPWKLEDIEAQGKEGTKLSVRVIVNILRDKTFKIETVTEDEN